jgi:hypothetical protein
LRKFYSGLSRPVLVGIEAQRGRHRHPRPATFSLAERLPAPLPDVPTPPSSSSTLCR